MTVISKSALFAMCIRCKLFSFSVRGKLFDSQLFQDERPGK